MICTLLGQSSSLIPFWIWTISPDRGISKIIVQQCQLVLLIHDPRYSPGSWMMRRRNKVRKAVSLRGISYMGRSSALPVRTAGESESTRNLTSRGCNDDEPGRPANVVHGPSLTVVENESVLDI